MQLYDYWFVLFDFPNEEGKPYKSSGGAMVWNEKLKREIPNPGYPRHFKYLKELPIVIPSLSIANKFVNKVKPLFEEWTSNILSNITLTKQRDKLLPLLMNGQASVVNI